MKCASIYLCVRECVCMFALNVLHAHSHIHKCSLTFACASDGSHLN